MKKNQKTDRLNTVEEWYCVLRQKNVPVETDNVSGERRCISAEACCIERRCENGYIRCKNGRM